MKTLVLPLIVFVVGLVLFDEKSKRNEDRIPVGEKHLERIIRVDSSPIVVHTEREGITLGDSERVLTYESGARFLLKLLVEPRTARDIVVYQHEKAVVKLEDDFLERLSMLAKEQDFRIIVLPPGVGKLDEDFDNALSSFLNDDNRR